jgi:hypothetical protein
LQVTAAMTLPASAACSTTARVTRSASAACGAHAPAAHAQLLVASLSGRIRRRPAVVVHDHLALDRGAAVPAPLQPVGDPGEGLDAGNRLADAADEGAPPRRAG